MPFLSMLKPAPDVRSAMDLGMMQITFVRELTEEQV